MTIGIKSDSSGVKGSVQISGVDKFEIGDQYASCLGTAFLKVPSGTTAERGSPSGSGALRYNSTTSSFEGYNGSTWGSIGGGGLSLADDTSTDASHYLVLSSAASGTMTTAEISSTKLTYNPSTGIVTSGSLIVNNTGSATTGAGQLYLNGSTSNRIDFNANGVAAPAFTTRSDGTKIVLYPRVDGTHADYALGIENNALWYSVPTSSQVFRWYAGTTEVVSLTGGGHFSCTSGITSNTRSYFYGNQTATLLTATSNLGGIECQSASSSAAAFMCFHRPGAYAAYFGIDTDNNFAVGGWSAGAALGLMKVGSFGVGTAASGTAGEIRATNNVTAYYSDERLKNNLGNISNAVSKILSINGFYYTENQTAKDLGYSNDRTQVGLSAQEVEKILPEAVTDAPIGNGYKTIWYDRLVPLLVEAVKEQQNTIDSMNDRIKVLEDLVKSLVSKS